MVKFNSNKMTIEIVFNYPLSELDKLAEWKALHDSILFLCANVNPEYYGNEAIRTALNFVQELLPDEDTAKKMILQP